MSAKPASLSGEFEATISASGVTDLKLLPTALATQARSRKRSRAAWATYKSQQLKKLREQAAEGGRGPEWVQAQLVEVGADTRHPPPLVRYAAPRVGSLTLALDRRVK